MSRVGEGRFAVVRVGELVLCARQRVRFHRWNGTRLSSLPNPRIAPPVGGQLLTSVSCPSTRSYAAVGFVEQSRGRSRAVAVRMRGDRWAAIPVPTVGGSEALSSVSCWTSGCVAVGSVSRVVSSDGRRKRLPDRGLVVAPAHGRWTAHALSVPASLAAGPKHLAADFSSVSCPPPAGSACVAIGARTTGLVERFDR